ncbi:MAG: threonyl-tRNA synthetase, partial [Pseudomonadota bacterium]
MSEITLTFPDGASRSFKKGLTGAELAASISNSLAKKAVAIEIDGRMIDLADPIEEGGVVRIIVRAD